MKGGGEDVKRSPSGYPRFPRHPGSESAPTLQHKMDIPKGGALQTCSCFVDKHGSISLPAFLPLKPCFLCLKMRVFWLDHPRILIFSFRR